MRSNLPPVTATLLNDDPLSVLFLMLNEKLSPTHVFKKTSFNGDLRIVES